MLRVSANPILSGAAKASATPGSVCGGLLLARCICLSPRERGCSHLLLLSAECVLSPQLFLLFLLLLLLLLLLFLLLQLLLLQLLLPLLLLQQLLLLHLLLLPL